MANPAEQVAALFENAQAFANTASDYAGDFISQLNELADNINPPDYPPPQEPPAEPTTITPPALTTPQFLSFSTISSPSDNPSAPSDPARSAVAPVAPTLSGVTMPVVQLPTVPAEPTLNLSVTAPTAPTIALPAEPTLLDPAAPDDIALAYPTEPDYYDITSRLTPPVPYTYTPGAAYASALLDSVRNTIAARMNASTGLPVAVEEAIWNRARSREAVTAAGNQAEILRTQEARGFALPTGAAAQQLREGQRDYYGKVSELSRDIAIKQAELEQSNAREIINQGLALESRLMQQANEIEQRSFEAAKVLADNAVAIHATMVNELQVLVSAYNVNATIFRAKIELQTARVEHYKARVQAYSARIGANAARVDMYRARIQANEAIVGLYTAQLQGNKTLVEIEQVKAQIFGERIRAYTAQIGGEVAKLELPKVQIQVDAARVDLYKAQVDGYAATASVENQQAQNAIAVYEGRIRALTAAWQGYAARVAAEGERVRAIASSNSALLERDRTLIQRDVSQFEQNVALFRTKIAAYEANSRLDTERARLVSEQYFAIRAIASEAAKVGAQVNAQLAASAFSTVNAQAQVSASDDINWNYQGEIASPANPGA